MLFCGEPVQQHETDNCPRCNQAVPAGSQYCLHCGAALGEEKTQEDIILSTGKHLRLAKDTLNLRELRTIVESGVLWWEQQIRTTEGVARKQAAESIKELSRVLDSLSQQLAQGRETVRITTRLPTLRRYSVGCPVCGHGNRDGARFCLSCGSPLSDTRPSDGEKKKHTKEYLSVRKASLSDVGKTRSNNEDTCFTGKLVLSPNVSVTLLLVADGMGGAQAGEEASRLASTTVQRILRNQLRTSLPTSSERWHTVLRKCVRTANQTIYAQGKAQAHLHGMGTTLTTLVITDRCFHLAHVGDSRAYLINSKGVTENGTTFMQLTSDHTLVARLVDIGHMSKEEARSSPQRSMLYRALGTEVNIEVDTDSQTLQEGDILLVCSDGLTNHVDDSELAQIVLKHKDPQIACTELVSLANQRGGRDNISVVVAMIE